MTTYLTSPLPTDAVKVRWQEPYVTSGLNQKTFGQYPKGVFAGFTIVPSGVALTVDLQVDPTLGISGANILNASTSKYCVTVIHTATVSLLLPFSQTVYIVLEAQYQVGTASTAQVRVVDASELSNPELVILAKVSVPASGVVATSQINMGYRHSAGDAVPLESQPPFNLLSNGTFERDAIASVPTGWVRSNVGLSVGVSGLLPHAGSSHSMVISSGGVISANVASVPMAVIPFGTYRAGAWIRSVSPGDIAVGTASIQVEWLDAAGASLSVNTVEGTFSGGSTTWVERKAEVTAPALAATAKLRAAFNGCSGTLYVDDAFFLTRRQDQLAATAVFGGPASIADAFHIHSSGIQAYGPGPNWFDGTTNPATSVSGQLDKIISDLSHATTGTSKIGNAPNKILNNVFASSVPNTNSIEATGNGTGSGVVGTSGSTAAVGVIGVTGIAAGEDGFGISGGAAAAVSNATGIRGIGKGTGSGSEFTGGATVPVSYATRVSGAGVVARGGALSAHGVVGQGGGGAVGVSTTPYGNVGVLGVGTTNGEGVVGVSAPGDGSTGVLGEGSDGFNTHGVRGIGKQAGYGGHFVGGGTVSAYGVYGEGSAAGGAGIYGKGTVGVSGVSGLGDTAGSGVYGEGGSNGAGVVGEAHGAAAGGYFHTDGSGPSIRAGVASTSFTALEIESPANTIMFGAAKTVSSVMLPSKFTVQDAPGYGVVLTRTEDSALLSCADTGLLSIIYFFRGQVNLPLGARVVSIDAYLAHSGRATFTSLKARLVKKAPSGTSLNSVVILDAEKQPSMSVSAVSEVFSIAVTAGAPIDTITSLNTVIYVEIAGSAEVSVAAALGIIYVRLVYTMQDWQQLP